VQAAARRGRSPRWPPACMPGGRACRGRPTPVLQHGAPRRAGLAVPRRFRSSHQGRRGLCDAPQQRRGASAPGCEPVPGGGRTHDGTRWGAGSERVERIYRCVAGQHLATAAVRHFQGPRALPVALVAPGAAPAGAAHACRRRTAFAAGVAATLQRCTCRCVRQRRSPRRQYSGGLSERPSSCGHRSVVCRVRRSTKGSLTATPSCARACCRPPWRRWRRR